MKLFFSQFKNTQTVPATENPKISDIRTSFLIKIIASLLTKIVTSNHDKPYKQDGYMGKCKPVITIDHYLFRFMKYLSDEPSLYILFLIYLNKYLEKIPDSLLNELNVHRLIACSVLVAYKQLMDERYSNKLFAKIAGVSLSEQNQLEIKFLKMLDFDMYVSTKDFEDCYQDLLACSHSIKEEYSNSIASVA